MIHDVVVEAFGNFAAYANTSFPPSRGNDFLLNVIALNTVERIRLMSFVEDTDGEQHHTSSNRVVLCEVIFKVSLFKLNFTVFIFSSKSML